MHGESVVFSLFLIFCGAALLATVALCLRQAMLVAYLASGAILGPWGLGLVTDADLIQDIARIGIIFLLFLLGLDLSPQKFFRLLGRTAPVTLFSALIFAGVAALIAWGCGFGGGDVLFIGLAACFSSTIIGLKLLPTTVLHHRHTGEVIISVLLLQDLIAIIALLAVHGLKSGSPPLADIAVLFIALPALGAAAWLGQRHLLLRLLRRFDRIQEYLFLLAIGWCLGVAQLAESMGLSYEIGAFTAGVAVAASPIAVHIAERLKPLRDFFLILFFFGLGAGFDLAAAWRVAVPAFLIGICLLLIKPVVFRLLLARTAQTGRAAWETGVRLGQLSEFSLLIVFVARHNGVISDPAFYAVQLATIASFIVSTYWIVLRYPTPIALSERLRRD
ncbi:MAG: cation:proton antiporter [Gammaproteobacteria bacterium]|nr:cation:proton antiporter [Gammaproteobacteria bacterium]